MSSRILVTGARGQVGSSLLSQLDSKENHIIAWDMEECDFSKPTQIRENLSREKPQVIFNACAYTAVDQAESDPDRADLVNREAPKILGEYCKENTATLIHYSTDYVFDGEGNQSRSETDPVGALNVYGQTKLKGERAIIDSDSNAMIFRTSWVYDGIHRNFMTTLLGLAKERTELRIVSDQIGAPTYAGDLARWSLLAWKKSNEMKTYPKGIYHLCHSGETSWFTFAQAFIERAQSHGLGLSVKSIEPIRTIEYPTPAKRPLNSRLSTKKWCQTFGETLRPWEAGMEDALKEFFKNEEDRD